MFGLGVNRLGATNQKPFSPASLFNNGEAGVWYDPSAASGSLDWRKNLLEYTEQFNNDYWQKLRGDVTPFESPIGDTSAFKFQQFSGQTIVPVIRTNVPVITGKVYTFSAFVKKGTRNSFSLHEQATTTGIDSYFNILNGTVSNQGSGHIARIQDAGNGWYRCSITYTAAFSASKTHDLRIGVAETTAVPDDQGFTYLWGAQLEEASTASSYQPILSTFENAFKTAFPSHTLYQDSQGETPVTAVGEPVGLMLDKSEGLAQGPELVTNGDFATSSDWILNAGWTISGGQAVGASTNSNLQQGVTVSDGSLYKVKFTISSYTSGSINRVQIGSVAGATLTASATGEYESLILVNTTGSPSLYVVGANFTGSIDNVSVTEIQGSHATQPTSTKRPIYARHPEGGIRNLLNYTEQFDNGAWAKTGVTVTPNTTIAPDGTQTADTAVFANTYGSSIIRDYVATLASTYTFSFYAKASSAIQIGARVGSANTSFTLSTEWQRFTLSASVTADANTIVEIRGGVVSGVTAQIWGAQLEEATEASNYQKRVTGIDVTESGVGEVYYLKFDGVDDGMLINNLTSGTTPLTALFGYSATNAESGDDKYLVDIESGRLALFAMTNVTGEIGYYNVPEGYVGFDAGDANAIKVLTYDLLENDAKIRIDGTQEYSNTNFHRQPLGGTISLFERHANSQGRLAGNMYQTILRAAESTDEEIAKTETYVANKTGLKAQVDGIATLDLNFGNNTYTAKNSNGGVI